MPITKADINRLRSLHDSNLRRRLGAFIAEGPIVARELFRSSYEITGIYALQEWQEECPTQHKHLLQTITPKELRRISALSTPNKVVVSARTRYQEAYNFSLNKGFTLVLDRLTDPGNMGSIIRTAEWFGIQQLICSEGSVDVYNPKVVQSAMGSLFRTRIAYTPLKEYLGYAKGKVPVYGAFIDKENILTIHSDRNGLLLIGSESHGISEELFPLIDYKISIPRNQSGSMTESLNASVATAIICYEMCRKSGLLT